MSAVLLTIWRVFPLKVWALALIVVAGLTLFTVARCDHERAERAQTAARQAEGRTESAVNAIKEISALEARNQATEAQVEQAHEAIRSTPEGPDRNRRARLELCRLHERPDCDRLFGPG